MSFFFTPLYAGDELVRVYEIYEERLCFLTPRPFICKKCIKNKQRFVQILKFDYDGPERRYECREWKRPFLE